MEVEGRRVNVIQWRRDIEFPLMRGKGNVPRNTKRQ